MPHAMLNGARIAYVEGGDPKGFPLLALAPGGLRSAAALWDRVGFSPLTALSEYRVIAMDQRNAGDSVGPIGPSHGWDDYTSDQLALLDHLGVDRFFALGMCIGGPFVMGLISAAPQRVVAGVLMQPIGLADNRPAFFDLFDAWRASIEAEHPEASEASWESYRHNMFGGDFLFNTSRAQAADCDTPLLLLRGDDLYHPARISEELAAMLPHVVSMTDWKTDPTATVGAIRAFLADHTP